MKVSLKPFQRLVGAAPIKRNREMVEIANAVLVIWDGESKGTLATINLANKLNNP